MIRSPSGRLDSASRVMRFVMRRQVIGVIAAIVSLGSVVAGLFACDAVTSIAVDGADFGGATADAHCDRRFTVDASQPSAFCQEIVSTVVAAQFSDDCRDKHQAAAGPGLCPRPQVIAGCKLLKNNDDHSLVWDWYYDVDGLLDAGPWSEVDAYSVFATPVAHSVADVAAICADRSRYEDGAELALP